jgi:2-dehydro-3-deoxyphosphooctonate aldolase (KDO 8-P synthase)
MPAVQIGDITIGKGHPLALIAGPCVIEDETTVFETAGHLATVCDQVGLPLIFKSSYEKDNRTSVESYTGPGLAEGLQILARVKREFKIPVTADVHRLEDIDAAADVLDLIQIPAFLCKQTSLLMKAGSAGKPVNIKKGQFLSPEEASDIIGKFIETGNTHLLLTERGTCFGYNHLIADMCSIPIMQSFGVPVVFDASHVVLRFNTLPGSIPPGGRWEFVPHLVRAAVAVGCNAFFIECHPAPARARCDAASMVPLAEMESLVRQATALGKLIREWEIA